MSFLNTLLRSTSATAIAANSAIGNASQISVSAFSIIEKIFASGITTTSSLSSDITRELMPHPSAWNTPCRAMLAPAKMEDLAVILALVLYIDKPVDTVFIDMLDAVPVVLDIVEPVAAVHTLGIIQVYLVALGRFTVSVPPVSCVFLQSYIHQLSCIHRRLRTVTVFFCLCKYRRCCRERADA